MNSNKTLSFKKTLFITVFLTWFLSPVGVTFAIFHHDLVYGGWVFLLDPLFRFMWATLTFVFILYYRKALPISISEMFSLKKINLKVGLMATVLAVVAHPVCSLLRELLLHGKIGNIKNYVEFEYLGLGFILFLLLELTGEIVHRGWMANAFSKVTSLRKANILQAGFFALAYSLAYLASTPKLSVDERFVIHKLPKILLPWFTVPLLYFFLVGCVSGRVFYKTKSLWLSAVVGYLGGKIFWCLM